MPRFSSTHEPSDPSPRMTNEHWQAMQKNTTKQQTKVCATRTRAAVRQIGRATPTQGVTPTLLAYLHSRSARHSTAPLIKSHAPTLGRGDRYTSGLQTDPLFSVVDYANRTIRRYPYIRLNTRGYIGSVWYLSRPATCFTNGYVNALTRIPNRAVGCAIPREWHHLS